MSSSSSDSFFDTWVKACRTQNINNGNGDILETDARAYFKRLKRSDDGSDSESCTSVSSSKELAKMIAKFGPIFDMSSATPTSSMSKVMALKCLNGSLQGIQEHTIESTAGCLPLPMMVLMSNFLMGHCGPTSTSGNALIPDTSGNVNIGNGDDSSVEDVSLEDVRDAALLCMTTLLSTAISSENNDINNDDMNSEMQTDLCIQFRIRTAHKSIQSRCASLEDCEDDEYSDADDYSDEDNDDGPSKEDDKILNGLSLLPRSRRSKCFSTLEAAIKGIGIDAAVDVCINKKQKQQQTTNVTRRRIDEETLKCLNGFTNFAASCLFGETDPRCLMQMLRLMKDVQLVLAPIVELELELELNATETKSKRRNKSSLNQLKFPYSMIFDAVAPYYPVRFTPPPNDPHGITKEGINSALMDVLTCSTTISSTFDPTIVNVRDEHDTNMTILAAGLFLERISPPIPNDPYGDIDDDVQQDISTVQDRLDALSDLHSLLLVPLPLEQDGIQGIQMHQAEQLNVLFKLNVPAVKDMSNVLIRCHEEAAGSVATSKNDDAQKHDNMQLANSCRNFATRIAYEFELQKRVIESNEVKGSKGRANASLWVTFVKDRVEDLAGTIVASPQSLKGRLSLAYIASLSASGGEKSLCLCLKACVPRLICYLEEAMKDGQPNVDRDEEKISTAAYGISVLFSSCRLSMEQITKDGIGIYPHPLKMYGSQTILGLCHIINGSKTNESVSEPMTNLEVAAVKALESVLQSTPSAVLTDEDTTLVRGVVFQIAQMIMDDIQSTNPEITGSSDNWKDACARVVGCSLGRAMKRSIGGDINSDVTFLESDPEIAKVVETTLFPKILESSISAIGTTCANSKSPKRHDWMILSYACDTDQEFATMKIVSSLNKAMIRTIQNPRSDEHNLKAKSVGMALAYVIKNGGPGCLEAFHSLPHIESPKSDLVQVLCEIPVSIGDNGEQLEELRMSALLLPNTRELYRSQADQTIKLSQLLLPCLLQFYKKTVPEEKVDNIVSRVSQVLPPLSDWDEAELFILLPILSVLLSSKAELSDNSRATLVNIIMDLSEYALSRGHRFAARSAASTCLFSIISTCQNATVEDCCGLKLLREKICPNIETGINSKANEDIDQYVDLSDAFNLAALVGSAAACRGRTSSIVSDEVARFLTLLACEGAVKSPVLGILSPLDCVGETPCKRDTKISSMAASALGSMFNIETNNPFSRQRLAHVVLPIILSIQKQPSGLSSIEYGCLVCACHVVCNINLAAVDLQRLSKLVSLIVMGIEISVEIICNNSDAIVDQKDISSLATLMIAAVLKMNEVVPSIVIQNLGTLVPAMLLINMTSHCKNQVALSLLSLQFLDSLTRADNDGVVHFCKAYKAEVLRGLARSIDHPSFQIRQAAVHVRNAWSVINS
uniref:MMS19 nucleotide excision repair protein n=1 Tax=Chaetoceros debilis TaxID=122233 RepID=A0A7S3Q246_9STRA|mmetsp:Transcript_23735/g.35270  ORF Transcript_23735/g.35270 Transcript_23735/m.35270 type:complete len:1409 (+) Transcript_23735:61-4287(+)